MIEAFDIALKISGGLGFAGILVTILGKKVTPRRSPAEVHDSRVAELERSQAENNTTLLGIKTELGEMRSTYYKLLDYTHDVREDFARETGKAPRDWPEGMRL